MHACRLNRDGRCATALAISIAEAPLILHSAAVADDDGCHARSILVRAYESTLRRRGIQIGEHAAASELYLWLREIAEKDGLPSEVNLGYLIRGARNRARSRLIHRDGKMRCGSCANYSHATRRCVLHGLLYGTTLSPDSDPRKLGPPCEAYSNRRRTMMLEHCGPIGQGAPDDDLERLAVALDALACTDPEAAALIRDVIDHKKEGARRRHGLSRRMFSKQFDRSIDSLKQILDDMP